MATHRPPRAARTVTGQQHVDVVVIGAGVIGLAVARRLADAGLSLVIIEQEQEVGTATSARNSEVIHAGIYYRDTPLKAELCIAGRRALYDYCAARHVQHRRTGKLIVAFTPQEVPVLQSICADAIDVGVDDLVMLSSDEARALEPDLTCTAAVFSPSTGIIDSHGYMAALLADAEAAGALLARQTKVTRLLQSNNGWGICIEGTGEPVLCAQSVVIAAGHGAQTLAAQTEGMSASAIPPQHYARGHYFAYHGQQPFSHLIYPVPVPGGLGTHLTLDLAGRARFGPDVEWIDGIDYQFGADREHAFATAARRIWPALDSSRLHRDYCGIRPKLSAAGEPAADFAIYGQSRHGLHGLVALYGIESPGLTASLAVADVVARELGVIN